MKFLSDLMKFSKLICFIKSLKTIYSAMNDRSSIKLVELREVFEKK